MAGAIESLRDHQGAYEGDADVVVVGSGASGAVVATELAQAGHRVVVLEEGPHVTPEQYGRMRPSESLRHIWRDGAMSIAMGLGDTPPVNVMMGRCVGGSSVLTGGVCFRTPEEVLLEWSRKHRIPGLTPKEMEPCFEHVERAIHVEPVPQNMRSRSTALFAEGAARQGIDIQPIRRNTVDCGGCGRCNFGCPRAAKKSVDLSYLPRAVQHGTRVYSHCRVDRVMSKDGRAAGVEGRLLNRRGGRAGSRFRVFAPRVVLAAGAWHTPLVLSRSGIANPQLGRNLSLHPSFRVIARFKEPVRGWRGALQSAYTHSFSNEGIALTSMFVPPAILAATMPGAGPQLAANAARLGHLAIFGSMIHDAGGGVVRRGVGREPVVTYRMGSRDRARVPRAIRIVAETFLAAGAEEVFLPVLGQAGFDADGLRRFDLEHVPARNLECSSQHPLGSCRMGTDGHNSVVDPDGQSWDLPGLFVADGSVMPTSLGVNPQLSVMAMATRIAWRMLERRSV